MDFEEASAEIQQLGLGGSSRSSTSASLALPTRRPAGSRAASPSTELLSITRSLRATRLVSPSGSPRRSVLSAPDDGPSDGGEDSMEEFEDFTCREAFDPDDLDYVAAISSPTPRRAHASTRYDEDCYSSGDEHHHLLDSPRVSRFATSTQYVGRYTSSSQPLNGPKSLLGRRSLSEDQLPRISIAPASSQSHLLASAPSGQPSWMDYDSLSEITEIDPDHIRNKLRSNSFSRDDVTLCSQQTSASAAFEHDKENHFNLQLHGGSAGHLGLPGDGSSAGTMLTVGIPRHALRVATDRGHNTGASTRRAKSVPVSADIDTLRAHAPTTEGHLDTILFSTCASASSSESASTSLPSSSSSEAASTAAPPAEAPMRVSSAPSISFTATSSGSLPLGKRLAQKSTLLHTSLNLSPRIRRSDASAFHSPARQGTKSRINSRAVRSLSPLGQPSPARPPSTPPVLPSFALNEPLGSMGAFSKSEPLLPSSSDDMSLSPMSVASPRRVKRAPSPMPQSPFQPHSLRTRSISLSNLTSGDWGTQTGTFPVTRRGRGGGSPVKHEDEECEDDDDDEDEQDGDSSGLTEAMLQAKRKRNLHLKLPRMSYSCSSLSDITQGYQKPVLPTVPDSSLLDAISAETVMKVLAGQYANFFAEVIIVDCRYPYEFEGGHIEGAINLPLLESIEERFPVNRDLPDRNKTIIIFHCEFSSQRGPAGIRHLRKLDRQANIDRHPKTCYPHVYLLRGGYKEFFEKGKSERCTPAHYRMMSDPEFKSELQRWNTLVKKRSWKKQKSQSFACVSTLTGKPM